MRILALFVATLAAAPALAGPTISLNGVIIDGVTDQRFENATVQIDAVGNVYITARGFSVKGEPAPPPVLPVQARSPLTSPPAGQGAGAPAAVPAAQPPATAPPLPAAALPVPGAPRPATAAPARLTRRYFLATEQTQPDGTQYDVEVFINAAWIRAIRSSEPQVAVEVTRYLRPGSNKVTLVATKKLAGAERRYYTRDVVLKVVVGDGNVGGDHVMIDVPLVVMTLTAAETADRTEEFTVEAH
jgi:hypothetical protein